MTLMIQQLVNGLMIGSTYALVALGFTLIIGVLGVLQMAHPEVLMFGAFVGSAAYHATGNILIALLVGSLCSGMLGVAVERVTVGLVARGEHLTPLIATIGASIFLQNLAVKFWSPSAKAFTETPGLKFFDIGQIQVSNYQLATFGVAVAATILLKWYVDYTPLGKATRATAENSDVVGLLGIDVQRVRTITVFVASMLAGIAGVSLGWLYNSVWAFMGINYGLKGLVVMIFGGVGSVEGAVVGGLLLGVIEALTVGFLGSVYRDMTTFAILVLVLLLKPSGLMGRAIQEKV